MPGARRRGRRIVLTVYGLVIATFTTICSVQILVAVYDPDRSTRAPNCRAGVRDLITAVERARTEAGTVDGERAALARFRSSLNPEWRARPALDEQCSTDPMARRSLQAVDRLRYAEEHAVRRAEIDLGPRRREVRAFSVELSAPQ